jgi:hypothetical protein
MSGQYNWQQKVLSHIWFTYCLAIPKAHFGPQEYLQKFATKAIKTYCADAQIRKLIGTWELTWGCAIYQNNTKDSFSNLNDHTMYVAKNTDNTEIDQYVISIAGTSPFSLQNILLENVNVGKATPWNAGQPWKSGETINQDNGQPAVSAGMCRALKYLTTQMWDGNVLLLDYLKQVTSQASKPVEITVAGHSLGGAMAPSLALLLVDRQAEWDEKKTATVKVVALAGFSPGNEAFANYYDATLGDKTDRLWNQSDIVPNLWEIESMRKIPAIYEPELPSNIAISVLLKRLEEFSQAQNYTQIKRSVPGFESPFNPSFQIQNLSKNFILDKNVVLDICAELVAYPVLLQIQAMPFLSDDLESNLTTLAKTFANDIKEVLDDLIENDTDTEDALKERLSASITEFTGIDVNLFFVPVSDRLEQLFSREEMFNLVNYVLQLLYHHTVRYSEYYGYTEVDRRREELTAQIAAQLEEEEAKIQTENTVIVNYGSAKKDDVDDLLRGEGKLLKGMSGIMERLKQSGHVSKNAQPVIFLVQKKKD